MDGFRGAASFSAALDASSLAAPGISGVLRYRYIVGTEGAALESAMLTFTTAAVPEPTAASFDLVGAVAMVARLRKRRAPERAGIATNHGAPR